MLFSPEVAFSGVKMPPRPRFGFSETPGRPVSVRFCLCRSSSHTRPLSPAARAECTHARAAARPGTHNSPVRRLPPPLRAPFRERSEARAQLPFARTPASENRLEKAAFRTPAWEGRPPAAQASARSSPGQYGHPQSSRPQSSRASRPSSAPGVPRSTSSPRTAPATPRARPPGARPTPRIAWHALERAGRAQDRAGHAARQGPR